MWWIGTASMAISTSPVVHGTCATSVMYGMALLSQPLYPVSMTFLAIAGVGGFATCVGLGFLAVVLSIYALLQMLAIPITLGIWVLRGRAFRGSAAPPIAYTLTSVRSPLHEHKDHIYRGIPLHG